MVRLEENELRTAAHQSSKGNQLKWESDGVWYKADYTGYEGLAEYIVSGLLKHSAVQPALSASYSDFSEYSSLPEHIMFSVKQIP